MASRTLPRAFGIALVALVVAGTLLPFAPRVRAGPATVFLEDFETGFLDSRWAVGDTNAAAGLDYWGVSGFRAHTGNYSAWAAQVGTQSSGGFSGQPNAAPGVQQYDDDMQTDLVIDVAADGYTSLTLSFWYYVRTENGGGDWLQAIYMAGGLPTVIFQQGGSSGNAWQPQSLSVPSNIQQIIFRFRTDGANHGFEGGYVDDIALDGVEDVPPSSAVSTLGMYTNVMTFDVPYSAQDNANASGVAYVELWYRLGSSGNFTLYNTTSNQNGQWTGSPIPFDASQAAGDGSYEFYTIAVDVAGNAETAPAAADATIVVDTTAPAVTFVSPTEGATVTSNATSLSWQGSDALSGVLRYEISLDGGGFVSVGLATSHGVTDLADGSHYAIIRAIDRAGNVRDARVNFTVNTQVPPPSDFGILWWILAVIAAAGLGLFLFFFARRKKDKDEEKKQGREPPRTPPSFGSSKGPPSPPPPSP